MIIISTILVLVVEVVIGVIVPFSVGGTLIGAQSTAVTLSGEMLILEKLFLRIASSSSKGGGVKIASSTGPFVAKSSARMTSTHVVAVEPDFKVPVESSTKVPIEASSRSSPVASSPILWVQWAILPKVCALMGPAGLASLLIFSLLLVFF